jgi:hypothetical protein
VQKCKSQAVSLPSALQKLLAHTTLTVTRMHVDLVAKDLAEAHKRASPGDNLRLRLK